MRIAFFEDGHAADLAPLTLLRPTCDLLCGTMSTRTRVEACFEPTETGLMVRPWLAETVAEDGSGVRVNDINWLRRGQTLLVNGRWIGDPRQLERLSPDEVAVCHNTVVAFHIDAEESVVVEPGNWEDGFGQIARLRRPRPISGIVARHPWHLVDHNADQIRMDHGLIESVPFSAEQFGPQLAVVGDPQLVSVEEGTTIEPFVVLDTTSGPIRIESDCRIQAFTRLEGPCFIGSGTQLFRANIRGGTSVGPGCRIGGEVETSILHADVNKYHDGFLGHSYICPWVNLGAATNNSDLKSDYSEVRVPLQGEAIATGQPKVGCFIGDHSKTALGSLFNTGSSIGVMAMVLPGGELLPKHIPSFSRIWHGELDDGFDLDHLIATAKTVMTRRDSKLTAAAERLLRLVHTRTKVEREKAILKAAEKQYAGDTLIIRS